MVKAWQKIIIYYVAQHYAVVSTEPFKHHGNGVIFLMDVQQLCLIHSLNSGNSFKPEGAIQEELNQSSFSFE